MKTLATLHMIAACALALGSSAAAAQPADPAAVKARLAEVASSYAPDHAFMGAVLVVRGETVLLDQGYGKADLGWGIDNGPDVKFRIGSLTKQFTAALVLLFQQDGKLSIADPVTHYLPDAPKAWAAITLAQLLGQTSGIADFTDDKTFPVWSMTPHTPAEKLAFIGAKPLEFEPGSKFEYSNSNYEVLGAVIEKVSGKAYGDLLSERLFRPLGMNDTGLDADDLILAKRAQGYKRGKDGLAVARSESMSVPWAAGSLYSTTGDLLRWERALFGGKVLSAASLQAMTTPGKGDYAMGLVISTRDGQKLIWHNGGIEGYHAYLGYLPQAAITIVVLANVETEAPDILGGQLLDVALGKSVVLDSERKAAPISEAELAEFEGAYDFSSTVPIIFARSGDVLLLKTGNHETPMLYEGVKAGHPTFYVAPLYLEIEFVPGPKGEIGSLILRQGDATVTVERRR